MEVVKIIKTCTACPTQYEGELEGGKMFYVRYRWGYLSIRVSKEPTKDLMDAVGGLEIYGEQHGDPLDGIIDDDVVLNILKDLTYENKRYKFEK